MTRLLSLSAAVLLVAGTAFAADPSASKDAKDLATPQQEKPAEQAQQPVPGPTPQETSRAGRPEERMHQGQAQAGTSGSGSSTAPQEQKSGDKKDGQKTQ